MQKSCLQFLPCLLAPWSWSCLLFALPLNPLCFDSSGDISNPGHSVVFMCFALILLRFSRFLNFSAVLISLAVISLEVNSTAFPFETSRRHIMILYQEGDKLKITREKRKEGAQPSSSCAVPQSIGLSCLRCRVETDWKRNTIPSLEDGIV